MLITKVPPCSLQTPFLWLKLVSSFISWHKNSRIIGVYLADTRTKQATTSDWLMATKLRTVWGRGREGGRGRESAHNNNNRRNRKHNKLTATPFNFTVCCLAPPATPTLCLPPCHLPVCPFCSFGFTLILFAVFKLYFINTFWVVFTFFLFGFFAFLIDLKLNLPKRRQNQSAKKMPRPPLTLSPLSLPLLLCPFPSV